MIVFQKSVGASNEKRSKRDGKNMFKVPCAVVILTLVLKNYIIICFYTTISLLLTGSTLTAFLFISFSFFRLFVCLFSFFFLICCMFLFSFCFLFDLFVCFCCFFHFNFIFQKPESKNNVPLKKHKNGMFFNVSFKEEFSIGNLKVVLLSVTCEIGNSNVELSNKEFQISSCESQYNFCLKKGLKIPQA